MLKETMKEQRASLTLNGMKWMLSVAGRKTIVKQQEIIYN